MEFAWLSRNKIGSPDFSAITPAGMIPRYKVIEPVPSEGFPVEEDGIIYTDKTKVAYEFIPAPVTPLDELKSKLSKMQITAETQAILDYLEAVS